MMNIPYDVWHRVAEYIPRDVLVTLHELNNSLGDISMKVRYQALRFVGYDKATKQLLRDIGCVALV